MGLGSSLVLSTLGQTGGAEVAAAASEASPGETVQWVVWLLCAALIGLFATIGQQARKPSAGAFLCGLVLYAADAAIFLLLGDWIGLALHALALYFIWRGWMAAREYQKL